MVKIFGYIICNKEGLSKEEIKRYTGIYCGICKTLEKKFGQLGRLSLNYDMTFLALFLTALYEPTEETREFRCPFHMLHTRQAVENKFTDYAASMTIALAYYKCLDDWKDEHKRLSYEYGKLLQEKFELVKEEYPRQCEGISKSLEELDKIEKAPFFMADEAVNCSGRMLAELLIYEEDFWSSSLRSFGYELGRFIYLADAAVDYNTDIKKHNYNPLAAMNLKPREAEPILTMAIGNATAQFEKLPIVNDAHLIRNVLYGGVWQKYYAKVKGKEKSDDFRSV